MVVSGGSVSANANGVTGSGLAGLTLWMSPNVAAELTGFFGFVSYGDITAVGVSADGTDTSGSSFGLDAGLRYVLGG